MKKKSLVEQMEDSDGCLPAFILVALIVICITLYETIKLFMV